MGSRGIVARVACTTLLGLGGASAPPAHALVPADRCGQGAGLARAACQGTRTLVSAVSATCRTALAGSRACALPAAPRWTPQEVTAAERGPVVAALRRQSRLADGLPFADAPWVGTHNSFNSIAEMGPALSAVDANQQLTLVDQLRIGVRSLELDVHWFLGGLRGPVVCHATGPHVGCTIEKALEPVLAPVRAWLDAHPDEVLLLYLENSLDGAAGETAAVAALQRTLGARAYRPTAGEGCTPLPLETLTRDAVRAAGAQVVLVSNGCGAGAAWRSWVFDWRERDEERPRGFSPFPGCGPHTPGTGRLVRYFEDTTGLTATAALVGAATVDDGLTPATTRAIWDCGVDVSGFDQLVPSDGRLQASVWSWAVGEPGAAAGDCAQLGTDGRWAARDCAGAPAPAACRAPGGSWSLTAPVPATAAAAACAAAGATHAAPRTGREGALLRAAAAGRPAWLALRRGDPGF